MELDDVKMADSGEIDETSDRSEGNELTKPKRSSIKEKMVKYEIDDVPPWYLCILLGLQHYITMVGGTISMTLILTQPLCIEDPVSLMADDVAKTELLATAMFTNGIVTLMQCTFGSRLPIIQGATAALLPPTFALLSSMGSCPTIISAGSNMTQFITDNPTLIDVVIAGSEEHKQIWTSRIRAIQGSLMVASILQIVVGMSGVLGLVMRYIGPMVICPTLMMIGLPLSRLAADTAGTQWGISILTLILMCVFSEYMKNVTIPCAYDKKNKTCGKEGGYAIFRLFPVILAIIIGYVLCTIFTYTNVFPNDPESPNYASRTDIRVGVISDAKWFRFPYPVQWGAPTVTIAGVVGFMAGIVSSIIESIGDYYACARLAGAPPPPDPAINRGIFVEGVGSLLAGILGTGTGTTSYSGNVAAIGVTKVASRRVIQTAGLAMITLGMFPKFSAMFVTIPPPVLGGVYTTLFGMIVAVGISNLQHVNLNSSRNILVLGVSIMLGLVLPDWLSRNQDAIDTGSDTADQLIKVLMGTNMFISGIVAFILDNTLPGTAEDRGLATWKKEISGMDGRTKFNCYDMPFGNDYIYKSRWLSYIPLSPSFLNHRKTKGSTGIENGAAKLND